MANRSAQCARNYARHREEKIAKSLARYHANKERINAAKTVRRREQAGERRAEREQAIDCRERLPLVIETEAALEQRIVLAETELRRLRRMLLETRAERSELQRIIGHRRRAA